jgi:hypothetical protein
VSGANAAVDPPVLTDPQAPPPAQGRNGEVHATGNLPGVRYVPSRACASHVMAIAPNGISRCVTATPEAQKLIDETLTRLGILGVGGLLLDVPGLLPFTGADLVGVAVAAMFAVGVGFVLYGRRNRNSRLAVTRT